jgi:hypothetical protein
VTGTWKGVTQVDGTRLTIVLRLRRGSDGTYSGTFESPDQHSGQIDMDQVSVRNGRLHVAVSGIQFTLDGALNAQGKRISATWSQHGVSMPIALTKVESAASRTSTRGRARATASKTDVAGTWRGLADVGGGRHLTMLLRFHREADGTYSGTFESPDQDSVRNVMDQVSCRNGQVHFEVNGIQFTFDGAVSADGKQLEGTWKQRDVSMPITLTRE